MPTIDTIIEGLKKIRKRVGPNHQVTGLALETEDDDFGGFFTLNVFYPYLAEQWQEQDL